jgi:hypothetical protein
VGLCLAACGDALLLLSTGASSFLSLTPLLFHQADLATISFPLALTVQQFYLAPGDHAQCGCWQHAPALHSAAAQPRWGLWISRTLLKPLLKF